MRIGGFLAVMIMAAAGAFAQKEVAVPVEARQFGGAAFDTSYKANLTQAEKVAGLWAEARYGFANFWHVPGLNWDKTYMEYLPQVLATRSTADYYRILTRFYACC